MSKQKPLEIRVFINDKLGMKKTYEHVIKDLNKELGDKENIVFRGEVVSEKTLTKVPRGYDLYILHIGDLRGDDFKFLREEQPWSEIIGISNAGDYEYKQDITDFPNYFTKIYASRFEVDSAALERDFLRVMRKIKRKITKR